MRRKVLDFRLFRFFGGRAVYPNPASQHSRLGRLAMARATFCMRRRRPTSTTYNTVHPNNTVQPDEPNAGLKTLNGDEARAGCMAALSFVAEDRMVRGSPTASSYTFFNSYAFSSFAPVFVLVRFLSFVRTVLPAHKRGGRVEVALREGREHQGPRPVRKPCSKPASGSSQ